MAGHFIVFEGIAGSGKKTHIKFLLGKLRAMNKEAVSISFPNFVSDIGKITKKTDFDPYTLSLLFAADRMNFQKIIKTHLDNGRIVICDRYSYSNFAYQSTRDVPLDWLMDIEKNILKPETVFLIDVPVDTSMRRIQQATMENFAREQILERMRGQRHTLEMIRQNYLNLSKYPDQGTRWIVIDGTKSIEEIQSKIWEAVPAELKFR